MNRGRWIAWLLAAALVLGLGASLLDRRQDDDPSVSGTALAATPADASPEAGFARDMKVHHAQAVSMADIIRGRSTDSALRLVATDIVLTQQNQIGQMTAWLELWGLPQARSGRPMEWMGMATDAMPGMANEADVAALRTLPIDDAQRAFLRLMIAHHQGGVHMAEGVLERTSNAVVGRLAKSVVASQTSEIGELQRMLDALD